MERLIEDRDAYLFHEGNCLCGYRFMGAHAMTRQGQKGVRFTVWAPNAIAVHVMGEFNHWQRQTHCLERITSMGIWGVFIPNVPVGSLYSFLITTRQGQVLVKSDPFAFAAELRPGRASRVSMLGEYCWQDEEWMRTRQAGYERPISIYEMHAGSWRLNADRTQFSYRQLASELVPYLQDMGYTHVELLPLAEHPLDLSWGYQITGFYAVTSRYGSPADFKFFVDTCHQAGIGVLLDWVPGHFCKDDHGLRLFDGTPLYEHWNPTQSENAGWGTLNFDFATREVRSFLLSNAFFWLDEYHLDGLRVDALANILYYDFGKEPGEWTPNEYGGRENIQAVSFIRQLNVEVFSQYPTVMMMAEDSSTWPGVTHPVHEGGLGFNYKWNMGWMNDSLEYMEYEPAHKPLFFNKLTFPLVDAFKENFILPLSHDEVVHGKRSLLAKMPGDYWQQFAGLRAYYAYWMAHPGKKLLFMGGDYGQYIEWKELDSLDWHLLDYDMHKRMHDYFRALQAFYRQHSPFWEVDFSWDGFEWIEPENEDNNVYRFIRRDKAGHFLLVVSHFSPESVNPYRLGVPRSGVYKEVWNSDASEFGGSGQSNGLLTSRQGCWHGREHYVDINLPPLGVVYLEWIGPVPVGDVDAGKKSGEAGDGF